MFPSHECSIIYHYMSTLIITISTHSHEAQFVTCMWVYVRRMVDCSLVRCFLLATPPCRFHPIREPGDEAR